MGPVTKAFVDGVVGVFGRFDGVRIAETPPSEKELLTMAVRIHTDEPEDSIKETLLTRCIKTLDQLRLVNPSGLVAITPLYDPSYSVAFCLEFRIYSNSK